MRAKAITNADAIEISFLSHALTDHQLTSEGKWQVELPGSDGGVILVGVLDIHISELGAIYDLKMTTSAQFMDRDQLCFYSLMGGLLGHETQRAGFIVPLRDPQVVDVVFSSKEFETLRERIDDALVVIDAGVNSGTWEARHSGRGCSICPVKGFCE